MKTLLFLLIFAIGGLVAGPVSATAGYAISAATATDSVAVTPTHRPARPQTSRVDGKAVAALVAGLGIAGSVFFSASVAFLIVAVFSVASIVLGFMSLRRIRKSNGQRGGRLLAWLGLLMGAAGVAIIGLLLATFSLSRS